MPTHHDAELREAAKLLCQVNQIILKANDLQRRFAPAPATAAVVRVVERAPNDQLEAHARAFLADTTDDPPGIFSKLPAVSGNEP